MKLLKPAELNDYVKFVCLPLGMYIKNKNKLKSLCKITNETLAVWNWTVYYDDTMLGLPDEYFRLGINNYEQDIVGVR